MKPHGERILGYLGLLKSWKEDRPPTPSDLKAWQEIWTINPQDLELIQEMAGRAHFQGKSAWERGDRDRALEIWQESWSLAPRDRGKLEEVFTLLTGWSADYAETASAYSRRLSYLKGTTPWQGLPPGVRRYTGAILASLLILGGVLALIPLLGPLLLPKPEKQTSSPSEGPVRPLPLSLEENLQGFKLRNSESVLRLFPETAVLSVSGKMDSPEEHFGALNFRLRMRDASGRILQEQEFTPDREKSGFWGGGSVVPFRKDFLLPLDEDLEAVRSVDMEAQVLRIPPRVRRDSQEYLAPETEVGDLKPWLSVSDQSWTQVFFTWNQQLVLEAGNRGTKPLKELAVDLVWKDPHGQPLFRQTVNLLEPGYPPLEAGEKFYHTVEMEFPTEVFPFKKEGFPVLEAQWKKVD